MALALNYFKISLFLCVHSVKRMSQDGTGIDNYLSSVKDVCLHLSVNLYQFL